MRFEISNSGLSYQGTIILKFSDQIVSNKQVSNPNLQSQKKVKESNLSKEANIFSNIESKKTIKMI